MRRLLVVLLVVVAALVGLDRLAVVAAQRDVAQRIRSDQHLDRTPKVTIHGFPFLTQLVSGVYDDVDVTVRGLHAGPVPISRLTVHLHGAHVSAADVFAQHVRRVPVDHATAELVLAFGDVGGYFGDFHLQVTPAGGDRVEVTATVAGVSVHASATVSVAGDGIDLTGPGLPALHLPLSGLPFGIRLTSVVVDRNGLVAKGSADGLVLRS